MKLISYLPMKRTHLIILLAACLFVAAGTLGIAQSLQNYLLSKGGVIVLMLDKKLDSNPKEDPQLEVEDLLRDGVTDELDTIARGGTPGGTGPGAPPPAGSTPGGGVNPANVAGDTVSPLTP